MAYIYKIVNDINEKIYIGKTCQSLERRFQEHLSSYENREKEKRPLYSAMKKYGIEHFHISLIEECEDAKASEREAYWIEFYQSYIKGYNATLGGDGKLLYDHQAILEELLKNPKAQEVAEKFACSLGTVYLIARANNITLFNPLKEQMQSSKKKVHQFSLNNEYIKTFDSINDASRWIKENKISSSELKGIAGHLSNCANGKRKTAFGFIWRY